MIRYQKSFKENKLYSGDRVRNFSGYINNKCNYLFVDSKKELEQASKLLLESEVISVDSERSYFNDPQLLQFCNNNFDLILIDLNKFTNFEIDEVLIPVFSSKTILKLIFDKKNDFIHFERNCYKFTYTCLNIIDIQTIGIGYRTKTKVGLMRFCDEYLNYQLNKQLQLDNWTLRPFKNESLLYAAMDSVILIALYLKIEVDSYENLDQNIYLKKEIIRKLVLKGKENKIDKKIEEDKIIKDFEQKCFIRGDNSYETDSYNSDDNNYSYDY